MARGDQKNLEVEGWVKDRHSPFLVDGLNGVGVGLHEVRMRHAGADAYLHHSHLVGPLRTA